MKKKVAVKLEFDFDAIVEAVTILIVNEPVTPPPLLWGGVGVGKTTFCEQIADALGLSFYQLPASRIDPAIIQGIPVADLERSVTSFLPPEFIAESKTFLLLDEINTAPESVVAGVMEAVRTRRIGRKVYEDLKVVLAANPTHIAAGGYSLPIPLKNRVVHFAWKLPVDHFRAVTAVPPFDRKAKMPVEGMPIAHFDDIRKHWSRACGLVDGFLKHFPHLLSEDDSEEGIDEDVNAFGTPRSWDYVKVILAVFWSVKATPSALNAAVLGTVGGAAYDFFAYTANTRIPAMEVILDNPAILLQLTSDTLYCSLYALTSYIAQNPTDEVVEKVFDIVGFLVKNKKKDYAMLLLDSLARLIKSGYKIYFPLSKLRGIDFGLLQKVTEEMNRIQGGTRSE